LIKRESITWHIIIKIISTEKEYKGFKREKTTYKGKPIRIRADFSTETLKAGRTWSEVFRILKENNFSAAGYSTQ
jgi:hypothetical protein